VAGQYMADLLRCPLSLASNVFICGQQTAGAADDEISRKLSFSADKLRRMRCL